MITRFLYTVLIILYLPIYSISQQVPNGGFEIWNNTGSYAQPDSWSTPNPSSAGLGICTVTKETTWVQSGSASAKLQTRSALGFKIPGLLTLGTFNINLLTMAATISGGAPFTGRPSSLTGYLQYQPKSGDNCLIGLLILRQNGSSWDTLGTGDYTNTATLNNWNQFVIPISYKSAANPTHLNIIIMSSNPDNPQTGSILYIDNLSFQYAPVEIAEAGETRTIQGYFNNNHLIIKGVDAEIQSGMVEICSANGRLVHREALLKSGNHFESSAIDAISAGIYLIRFYGNKSNGQSFSLSIKTAAH
jgi:hypothetical protein